MFHRHVLPLSPATARVVPPGPNATESAVVLPGSVRGGGDLPGGEVPHVGGSVALTGVLNQVRGRSGGRSRTGAGFAASRMQHLPSAGSHMAARWS